MTLSDSRRVRKSRRRRITAAVAAAALALFGSATGAQAAPDDAGRLYRDPDISVNQRVFAEGADIAVAGQTYATGPLTGNVDLVNLGRNGVAASGLALSSPVDGGGDFGQVRVVSVEEFDPEEILQRIPFGPNEKAMLFTIQVEYLPGAEADRSSVTLTSAPAVFAPRGDRALTAFPPVNQVYSLQAPVQLFDLGGDAEAVGVLERFTVIVNRP